MKAMILAAGVGSRLRPLTNDVSKPLTPVVNKPVMEHIVTLLRKQGVTEIIANLHYLGDQIKDYFGNGHDFGVNLSYSEEKNLMGTAGGVKKAEEFFDETFIIISGDAITDINIQEVYNFHKGKKALATICLKEVDDVEKYGIVITDNEGKISSFQEKPSRREALSKMANTGIYIFEPEIFNYIPADIVYDFGKELFPKLVDMKAPFYGYQISDYWNDVGSFEEYFRSHMDALEKKVNIEIPGTYKENIWQGENIKIDATVKTAGKNLIGDKATLSQGVCLNGNVIIGNECNIGAGTILENVIIYDKEQIPGGCSLKNCIVGSGHVIQIDNNGCEILEKSEVFHK